VGLQRMGKNRTQKKGNLTNYGVVAGRIEPVKNADYSDVIMGVSGVFYPKTQLNDALIVFE
jgi:methylmalonyl-CoA mutase cobalamin-binding subunit